MLSWSNVCYPIQFERGGMQHDHQNLLFALALDNFSENLGEFSEDQGQRLYRL